MKLTWFRMDNNIATNKKIARLMKAKAGRRPIGGDAFAMWIFSIGYCQDHGYDGFIDRDTFPFIHGRDELADALVEVGLFDVDGEGWRVHDFGESQPTAAGVAARTALQSAGGRKGNCIKYHGPDCGCWKNGGDSDA